MLLLLGTHDAPEAICKQIIYSFCYVTLPFYHSARTHKTAPFHPAYSMLHVSTCFIGAKCGIDSSACTVQCKANYCSIETLDQSCMSLLDSS